MKGRSVQFLDTKATNTFKRFRKKIHRTPFVKEHGFDMYYLAHPSKTRQLTVDRGNHKGKDQPGRIGI